MRLIEQPLAAAALLEQERHRDERGFFARAYCQSELETLGLGFDITQANLSSSPQPHTLRGLHLQIGQSAERKLVQCLSGAIFDVIVDLRPASPDFRSWRGFELSARNGRMLVIPEGFAHGFLTLEPDVIVLYFTSGAYAPAMERGFRFDDPAFTIDWPHMPAIVSRRDLGHAPFHPDLLAAT